MTSDVLAKVRTALGSGRWFPGNGIQLEAMVDSFINSAEPANVKGRICGAIAPHAGYVYSGPVAGCTFRAIRDNAAGRQAPDVVLVLGFCHSMGFPGVAVMDGKALKTPLGEVELDVQSAGRLVESCNKVYFNYAPHAGEHSAENQVPFIQRSLPGAAIVVCLMGSHEEEVIDDLVKGLIQLAADRKVLVVASTDLLHHSDYELVKRTDTRTLEVIGSMDESQLRQMWSPGRQVCCGIGPVLTVMRFAGAQGCREGRVLRYRNSGDDYPESRGSWVVGYGAVVFS